VCVQKERAVLMVLESKGITEQGLGDLRSRVGSYYRTIRGNEEVTLDAIRHFVHGVGDPNPLWVDEEYAKKTRWGGIIAPPTFLYSVIHPSGMQAGGLPGVHAFHAGNDWEWYKPIWLGDVITGTYRPIDVVEKQSKFSGATVIVYAEIKYFNQLDELVAQAIGWSVRSERRAAREKGKYSNLKIHRYEDEEIEAIYRAYENEEIRGLTPRYWEDVNVGDEIPPVVKGPFTIFDTIAWWGAATTGILGTGTAHELRVRELARHPSFGYRDSRTGGLERVSEVHASDAASRSLGLPAAYDLGAQRNSWMAQPLTHWMGDEGFLKKLYAEYRRFNIYGDTQWIKGKVTKKYVENTEHLVDVDVWCENQRGEVTAPGRATIVLPSKSTVVL
jgi:acyl dehydratase